MDDEGMGHRNENSADRNMPKRRHQELGAELDKDGQIWEIYVDETDRSDKELVKGWN
ncbi:hypothetical protein FRC06_003854, partial [Ceratobasidium sp. 370]